MTDRTHPSRAFKPEDIQCLVQMQLTGITVFIGTAIVVQPIGQVGILLNFSNDDSFSDGVPDGPRQL